MARNANNTDVFSMHYLVSSMPMDGNWNHAALLEFEVHSNRVTVWTTAGLNGSRRYLSSHRKVMTLANARKLWAACRRNGWVTYGSAAAVRERQHEMIEDLADRHFAQAAFEAA